MEILFLIPSKLKQIKTIENKTKIIDSILICGNITKLRNISPLRVLL